MFANTATRKRQRRSEAQAWGAVVAVLALGLGWTQEASATPVAIDLAYVDTTIKKRHPNENYVTAPELEVSGGPGWLAAASLFLPDLEPLAGNFVLRATLTIIKTETFREACCDATSYVMSVGAVGSAWLPEEVTWRNQPRWGGPASVVAITSSDPPGTQYQFDITQIVQAWMAGDLPNQGLALAVDRHFATPGNKYGSSQAAPIKRPRIEILMTPEPGTVLLVGLGLFILVRLRERLGLVEPMLAA